MHHLTFPILFSEFIYCYGIAYSVRCVGFHLYNLLSTSQSTSIRVFLNTASFFASLPVVSGVSSTLAHKIIYRVMASVESDYTALAVFKVQKRVFWISFHLLQPGNTKMLFTSKKILSLIRRYRGTFDTLFWKIHKKFTFASFVSL